MTRESADVKARRYLAEGRLTVVAVNPFERAAVVATCRGDSGELYDLGYDASRGEWRCTCEAARTFRRTCSHLRALQLVTVRPS